MRCICGYEMGFLEALVSTVTKVIIGGKKASYILAPIATQLKVRCPNCGREGCWK